jgi:3-hydroxybutyryl-CoA dehydrogenase
MRIDRTAVIGAGIMGRGVALTYALHGFKVSLYDCFPDVLTKTKRLLTADLDLLITEGLIPVADQGAILSRIKTTDNLIEAVEGTAFITEAVPEQLDLKWRIYARLEELTPPETIIASNTSTLPLSDLTRHLKHPQRMIITHFFNPAHLVPLVEVVKAVNTPTAVLDTTLALLQQIGKMPVVLRKEVPGFIANRLQAAVMREALFLVDSGVADMRDVDTAMTAGRGFAGRLLGHWRPQILADSTLGRVFWITSLPNSMPAILRQRSLKVSLGRVI